MDYIPKSYRASETHKGNKRYRERTGHTKKEVKHRISCLVARGREVKQKVRQV